MEYKRIWMPYEDTYHKYTMSLGVADNDETKKADEAIANHLRNGWRIASTCPVTITQAYAAVGGDETNHKDEQQKKHVYTYTSGIEVFLVKD